MLSHELATAAPAAIPEGVALTVSAGACELSNSETDRFGGGGLAAFALPGSDSAILGGGCTIRGMLAGVDPSAEGIGVAMAAPGTPLSVCNS